MSTTQRSESMNSFFDAYVNPVEGMVGYVFVMTR